MWHNPLAWFDRVTSSALSTDISDRVFKLLMAIAVLYFSVHLAVCAIRHIF